MEFWIFEKDDLVNEIIDIKEFYDDLIEECPIETKNYMYYNSKFLLFLVFVFFEIKLILKMVLTFSYKRRFIILSEKYIVLFRRIISERT